MEFTSTCHFDAAPKTIQEMFSDRSFLESLVSRADANASTIEIAGPSTRVTVDLPVPEALSRFAGATMQAVVTMVWDDPAADGSRTGTLGLETPGLPTSGSGRGSIAPEGAGTRAQLTGSFAVTIPLMGRQVERIIGSHLDELESALQDAGEKWIADRS